MKTKHDQNLNLASTEQVLDIQRLIGRALMKMPANKATEILRSNANQKVFIKEFCSIYNLKLQDERALLAIPKLIKYYNEVYGLDVSEITDMSFPLHETLRTFMVVSPKHNEDEIMEALAIYFNIGQDKYKNPVINNIDCEEENRIQKRPSGLYLFSHLNQDEPDAKHRGKSYDDTVNEKLLFTRAKEYLLIWGYKKYTEHKNMDTKGWTRTASLWSGGGLVGGGWRPSGSGLCLNGGDRGDRDADDGPRELFLDL